MNTLLAQNSLDYAPDAYAAPAGPSPVVGIIELVVIVAVLAGMWKMFVKAGKPGWAAIIPIYNVYVLTQIVGRPAWWVVLMFIPFVSFIIAIILMVDLAKSFGKSGAYALLMFIGIGYLMLGFGDAKYVGPKHV
jgi:hypothetical protein